MTDRVALILAAGEGTRMKSDLPKVLHPLCGKTLLAWVLDAVEEADYDRAIVVVGHGGDRVREEAIGRSVEFVTQEEQKGTGHAVLQAEPLLRGFDGTLAVLSGDVPLIRSRTLRELADRHEEDGAGATIITTELPDPAGYGRIVRGENGLVEKIVEEKDASDEERAIREVNSGTYCFRSLPLFEILPRIGTENASGEVYLTDSIAALMARRLPVLPHPVADRWEVFGINTVEHLRLAAGVLAAR